MFEGFSTTENEIKCNPVRPPRQFHARNLKVMLTERFDEGLMVLRRLLGWSMVDMTYVSMYKTATGSKRYDGKSLVQAPRFEDLPIEVKQHSCEKFQNSSACSTPALLSFHQPRVRCMCGGKSSAFHNANSPVSARLALLPLLSIIGGFGFRSKGYLSGGDGYLLMLQQPADGARPTSRP